MKTDLQIKNIAVASVRRHGMQIETWVRTRLWDNADPAIKSDLSLRCEIASGELPILYSYIDTGNWTLVTTRRVWYPVDQQTGSVLVRDIAEHRAGNFKGHGGQTVQKMAISAKDGGIHFCPFETGLPSMGPIYAIRTLCLITGYD
jgi:hypothetical protein